MLLPKVGVKLFGPKEDARFVEAPNVGVFDWLCEVPKTGVLDFTPGWVPAPNTEPL